jgi:hypothetical protein
MTNHGLLERAFALAESGEVCGLVELRRKLAEEGYSQWQLEQLAGSALHKQLKAKMDTARSLTGDSSLP